MAMSEQNQYRFLEPRPCSNYRQLFIKGRRIRAEVLYRQTVGEDPRTPEQVADDEDFHDLHDLILGSGGSHPGILLVRYDNDTKRDMKAHHVVRAIRNLEQAGFDTTGQLVILNHWR